MRHFISRSVLLVLLFGGGSAGRQAQPAVDLLDGLDPIELVAGREVPGKSALGVEYRGYRYLFATEHNLAAYKKDPARYEPVAGGSCARMGAGGPGNPALFTVVDGRIYLFASDNCRKVFMAAPNGFIEPPADERTPTEAARRQGRAIVDRAVRALGGAANLDALAGYTFERSRLRNLPGGPQQVPERVTVLLPDAIRTDSTAPGGSVVSAAAGGDMFLWMQRGTESRLMRFPEAPRVAAAREATSRILRDPIGLLRARNLAGTIVAAVEGPRGPAIEFVRVTARGVESVLGVDRTTGLPSTLTFNARGRDGTWRALTLTFGDYRAIDGVRVPFRVDAAFPEGRSEEESFTLTEWRRGAAITREELMRVPAAGGMPR